MITSAELLKKMNPDCISVQKGMKMWYVAAKSGHCTFHHFHFFNSEEEASVLCARVRRHLAQNGKLNMDHWTLITGV